MRVLEIRGGLFENSSTDEEKIEIRNEKIGKAMWASETCFGKNKNILEEKFPGK